MAYSERAQEVRRCKATRRDGQPCQAWAIWGAELCSGHTYKKKGKATGYRRNRRTNAPPCKCIAYAWPHRPGAGVCNWPDLPVWKCTTPAGTHRPLRLR